MPVAVLRQRLGKCFELFRRDPALAEGDFFRAGNLEALAFFNGRDELAGFEQAIVGAGVEPGIAATHDFDVELSLLEVEAVEVGDLEFAAGRGLEVAGQIDDLVVVEVEAGDGVVGLGLLRLFFEAKHFAAGVELGNAVALGVMNMVGEDRCAGAALVGAAEDLVEVVAVEDVVTQHQGRVVVADEVGADDEGLGEAVRAGLDGVLQVDTPFAAVAEKLLEARGILWGRDDQDVADAGQQQRGQRVVDHRLVVDRQQLLGDRQGGGMEPGTGAAGEDEAFAGGHGSEDLLEDVVEAPLPVRQFEAERVAKLAGSEPRVGRAFGGRGVVGGGDGLDRFRLHLDRPSSLDGGTDDVAGVVAPVGFAAGDTVVGAVGEGFWVVALLADEVGGDVGE